MKQTNNALKFLKAQYKAIFQSAYFKGLAAVIACSSITYAPLAHSKVFDESFMNDPSFDDVKTKGATIYIDGTVDPNNNRHFELMNISAKTGELYFLGLSDFIISVGSKSNTNIISPAGGMNDSPFEVKSMTMTSGSVLHILSASNNITGIKAREHITLEEGEIFYKNDSSKNMVLNANTLNVGKKSLGARKATISLDNLTSVEAKYTNLYDGALIELRSGTSSISAQNFNIFGGILEIKEPSSSLDLNIVSGQMNSGNINIGQGNTLTLTFESGDTPAFDILNGTLDLYGTLNIVSDDDKGGSFSISENVIVNTDKSNPSAINVSGALTTLAMSKHQFDELSGRSPITLDKATLYIKDDESVILGNNQNLELVTADPHAGAVAVTNSATIKSDMMIVDGAVKNGSNVKIDAHTLILKGDAHNLAGMNAANVIFESDTSDPYKLQSKLSLSNTKKVEDKLVAAEGFIRNDVLISGSELAIDGGIYSAKDNMKLDSGTLTIGDANAKASSDVTLLDLSLDNSNGSNNITIAGAKGAQSTLHITEDTHLTLSGAAATGSKIEVQENGNLNIAGNKLNTFLDSNNWSGIATSGGAIYVNGGTVTTSDVTLDAAMLIAAADANSANYNIVFNSTSGGKLLTNNLTLTDTTGNGLAFDHANGKSMVRVTDTLNISAKDASGSHAIKQGNFFVGKKIKSDNSSSLTIGDKGKSLAILTLGELSVENNVVSHSADSGSIGVALTIAGENNSNKSKLAINYGTWDADSISATNADMTVGFDLSQNTTLGKYDHKWGLDVDKLSLSESSTLTIHQNNQASTTANELVVDELSVAAGSKISLFGDMILNGKSGAQNNGIDLKTSAIDVETTGYLTITGEALKGISINGDNVSLTGYALGSITTNPGAVVKLDLANDFGTISQTAIENIRKELFGKQSGTFIEGTLNLGGAQIAGLETDANGKISWDKIEPQKDIVSDVTNNDLQNAKVTDVDDQDKVRGSYGSISSKTINSANGGQINTDGVLTLSDAQSNNGYFAAQYHLSGGNGQFLGGLGFIVDGKASLILKNGGKANEVTLREASELVIDGQGNKTEITSISGSSGSKVTIGSGTLEVTNERHNAVFNVGSLSTQALTSLKLDSLETTDDKNVSSLSGNVEVSGESTFAGNTVISGNSKFANVTFSKDASIKGNKTKAQEITASGDLHVYGNATLAAKVLSGTQNKTIFVGNSSSVNGDGSLNTGSNGVVSLDRFNLNKGSVVADPDFSMSASFVGADVYGDKDVTDGSAGEVNGKIYALQNSIIAIGNKDDLAVKDTFRRLIEADGSLQNTSSDLYGIGAIGYVAKKVALADGSQIVVDQNNTNQTYQAQSYSGNLVIGENSALAIDANALSDSNKAAIHFNQNSASINVANEVSSKILLTGDIASIQDKDLRLFSTNKPDSGVTLNVTVGNSISIESLSGLYSSKLNAGKLPETVKLSFQLDKAQEKFASVTGAMKDTLIAAASGFLDYDAPSPTDKVLGEQTSAYKTSDGTTFTKADGNPIDSSDPYYNKLQAVKVDGTNNYVVYTKPENKLINHIVVNNGAPIDAETSMNLAVFGGAPQVALQAGAAAYDTISSRMGIGLGTVRSADNGQGKTLWVTPIYKNADYDGLAIENQTYGTDIKLYGMTIGADFELQPNLTVGAMFSAGSGDVSGTNLASNVSNDFNYYGLGLYAGYGMDNLSFAGFEIDNLSFIADLGYTMVDNDLEGKTGVGTLKSSADSSNLSFGVTGKADFKIAEYHVTPHAGVRLSLLELDDFGTEYSQSSVDSLNIFSVPVGVTIAKEIEHSGWLLKPSVDVTVTGNFGDTEVQTDTKWSTYSNLKTSTKSEVLDDFSYGATLGISARSGSMYFDGGLNYTSSSSMDELGLNANASYTF